MNSPMTSSTGSKLKLARAKHPVTVISTSLGEIKSLFWAHSLKANVSLFLDVKYIKAMA